jgi:hypothetical protein
MAGGKEGRRRMGGQGTHRDCQQKKCAERLGGGAEGRDKTGEQASILFFGAVGCIIAEMFVRKPLLP